MTVATLLAFAVGAMMQEEPLRVLVFSKTASFRHDSIPAGKEAFGRMAEARGWDLTVTEEASVLEDLGSTDVVVFLLTTGDVMNETQEASLLNFMKAGGGWVGVHSASDTEYSCQWYGEMVGAYFAGHPAVQPGKLTVEDPTHPTTEFLPDPWWRTDEWYDFKQNPRERANILVTLDESTYQGGNMGADHPMTWWRDFEGGRSWYTGMGHTIESYSDELFLRTLETAVEWVGGRLD